MSLPLRPFRFRLGLSSYYMLSHFFTVLSFCMYSIYVLILIFNACEHLGVSPRTFKPVSSPLKSSIRDNSEIKNHTISISDFKVRHTCKSQKLRLTENILTHKLCLNLNAQDSSFPHSCFCKNCFAAMYISV